MNALSIRQPWAWMIVNGHKDIENRPWKTHYRGQIYVHAAKGMTHDEYGFAADFARKLGVHVPPFDELERGGIVGTVKIVDCVDEDPSPWFFGEYGFLLKDPKPLPFTPLRGKLGYFPVDPEQLKIATK
ncbi:ASCH domain-containing protein [Luteolibacter pohnpeiensis]|uniref:ASCH domain-containing protein n=1 Tax=Luteolibacter pohnpeiensis TaxID=454153 RepID=A0A934SEI8_9BACT|nr:ASCH domain-containing protein [Luteolibacter pohnpeiensis]MBK1884667.1 ASCH domain-containing protein [Luteolibacter pohnpeiensis]